MTKYFNPNTLGFYDTSIHGAMPQGCISLTDDEYHNLLNQQSQGKTIKVKQGKVVAEQPIITKQELIETLKTQLNNERDNRTFAGFSFQDKPIQSQRDDIDKINGAAIAAQSAFIANQAFNVSWTCGDNTQLELDAQGVIGLHTALVIHTQTLHAKCLTLKASLEAKTKAQLEAFNPSDDGLWDMTSDDAKTNNGKKTGQN